MEDVPAGDPPARSGPDADGTRTMKLLASTACSCPDPLARKHAVYLLGVLKEPEHSRTLLQALRDPEKAVRSQAMQALALLGDAVGEDLVSLLSDPDWKVRYRAAEALGRGDVRGAVTPLIGALHDEKDHVRYMAAKSLGLLRDPAACEPLGRLLMDENSYVRNMAEAAREQCRDLTKYIKPE